MPITKMLQQEIKNILVAETFKKCHKNNHDAQPGAVSGMVENLRLLASDLEADPRKILAVTVFVCEANDESFCTPIYLFGTTPAIAALQLATKDLVMDHLLASDEAEATLRKAQEESKP